MHFINQKVLFRIKKHTLLLNLTVLLLLLTASCIREDEEKLYAPIIYDNDSKSPIVTFVYNDKDCTNVAFNRQIKKTINYTKIPYSILNLKTFNQKNIIPISAKVLVVTDLNSLSEISYEKIIEFIVSGGTLYLPISENNYRYKFLAGIKPDAGPKNITYANGYLFKNDFIPGFKNKNHGSYYSHKGYTKSSYNENVSFWALASTNENFPTITNHKLEKGNVVAFNSKQKASKQDRGLYFSSIISGLEGIPYPIPNVGSIFLDDFPAPTYDVKKDPIKTEYDLTHEDFYKKVWWPDMVNFAKQENLKYTIVVCFDYQNITKPPFLFKEWKNSTISTNNKSISSGNYFIKDILKNDHELALHGYNHKPLTKEGWPNAEFMSSSLEAVSKKWKLNNYGSLPVTYVPPSNYIDELGFDVLSKSVPSIKYNCSLYFDDYNSGGNREYDYEPFNNYFFNFPRISHGYVLNDAAKFNIQSLFLFTGVWSHFIHPDDVYQVIDKSNIKNKGNYAYRNKDNLGWNTSQDGSSGMFPRLKKYVKDIKQMFPLMQFKKVKDAAKETKEWRYSNYNHIEKLGSYKVKKEQNDINGLKQHYWFTYIKAVNKKVFEKYLNNNQLLFTKTPYLEGFLYNIKTKSSSIELKKILVPVNANNNTLLTKNILQKAKAFKNIVLNNSKNNEIDLLVLNGKLKQVIDLLIEEIDHNDITDFEKWLNLNKYLSWTNQQKKLWTLLDAKYLEKEQKTWVNLSLKLMKFNFYPDNDTQILWMKRQLKLYPDNIALKWKYYTFLKEKTKEKSDYLSQLCAENILDKIEESELENKADILNLLLDCNSKKTIKYLNAITPCKNDNLILLADKIAWFYSDNNNPEKAAEWANCSKNISKKSSNYWKLQSGDYSFLKQENLPEYINYLIQNNPKKAIQELDKMDASCKSNFPYQLLKDITYLYASSKKYKKALKWSNCIEEQNIKEQLYWLIKEKNYRGFENKYSTYKKENPEDSSIDLLVAKTYSELGKIKKSWVIASKLSESKDKETLRAQLNKDVQYINRKEQKFLLEKYNSFFYPEIAKKIEQDIVLNENPFIKTKSNMITDPSFIIGFNNNISFGFYDGAKNTHFIGATQNKRFPLYAFKLNNENTEHNLYGLYYKFKQKQKFEKPYFDTDFNIERDNFNKMFYQANVNIYLSKKKTYSFLNINHRPEITSIAYSLNIYRTQIIAQHERDINKKIKNITTANGIRFTDNAYTATLQTSFLYNLKVNKHNTFSPNIEAAATLGSKDNSLGYPYWIIKKRFFTGGGIIYNYNNSFNKLLFSVGTSYFYDTLSNGFARVTAKIQYPLFNYFHIGGDAYISSVKNQFSNEFNFGLTYYIN